jgi:hypothetical protein
MVKVRNAVLLVLACALGLRLADELVRPLLPALIVLAAFVVIGAILFRRDQ